MPQPLYDIPMTAPYAFHQPQVGGGGMGGGGILAYLAAMQQRKHETEMQQGAMSQDKSMNELLNKHAIELANLHSKIEKELQDNATVNKIAADRGVPPSQITGELMPMLGQLAKTKIQGETQMAQNQNNANNPSINPGIAQANALGANATAQKPMTDQQVALRQTAPMGGISVQPNVNGGFDTAKGGTSTQSSTQFNPYILDKNGKPTIASQEQSTGIPGSFNPGQPPFKPEDVPPIDNTSAAPDAAPQTAPFQMNSGLFNPSAGVSNMLGGSTPPVGAIQSPSASSAMPDVAPAQPSISSMDVSGLGPVQEWLKQFLLRQAQSTMPQVQPR